MSSATAPLKLPDLTEGVIDLAQALGGILVAKVNDTVKEAIACEAKIWRTDALHILTEFRKDIECCFRDSDANHRDEPSTSRSLEAPVSAVVSNQSNVSCFALPMSAFRKDASLEQRRAAVVFAATFAEHNPHLSNPETHKGQNTRQEDSFPRHPAASSHDQRNRLAFDALIPSDQANIEHIPGEVTVDDYEAPSTSSRYQSTRSIHDQFVVATSSSRSCREDTTSQTRCFNALPPCLESIPLEHSTHTRTQDGYEPERELSQGVVDYLSGSLSCSKASRRAKQWNVEARTFYDERSPSASKVWGLHRSLFPIVLRSLGINPWSMELVWLSWMYQGFVLCCVIVSTLSVAASSFSVYWSGGSDYVFASHVEDILALGTLLCFLAAVWKSQALEDTSWLIESYLSRAGLLEAANEKSRREFAAMFIIWLVSTGSHFYANALALSLSDVGFAISVLVLLAICFCALSVCHCLLSMVEHFCEYMQDISDFDAALQEFFLLHCTIRFACTSLQLCFVVLQLAAIGIFLFCSASIYIEHVTAESVIVTLIPGVLCEVVLLQLSIRAGLVSDLCARVPMLVNSVNAKLEMKRMYVVDYIAHCQAGFYIFEVRLSTSALLKLFYVAFVAWCGLLTQGLIK